MSDVTPTYFPIARMMHKRDSRPTHEYVTWAQLSDLLSQHRKTPCAPCPGKDCTHKDGPSWAPVVFSGGERSKKTVLSVYAAVFDLDDGTGEELKRVQDRIRGFAAILHSTHGFATEGDRYRLVMQLSRPVTPDEWPTFRAKCAVRFGFRPDPNAKDCSRLFFLPSGPEGEDWTFDEQFGSPIDVEGVLRDVPLPVEVPSGLVEGNDHEPVLAHAFDVQRIRDEVQGKRGDGAGLVRLVLSGKPVAASGGRDNNLLQLAGALSLLENEISTDQALALVEPSIRAMECHPEGFDHWLGVFKEKYERALVSAREIKANQKQTKDELLSLLKEEPGSEWRSQILWRPNDDGGPASIKHNEANAELLLTHHPEWAGKLRFDVVRKQISAEGSPIGRHSMADLPLQAAVWLQRSEYHLEVRPHAMGPILYAVARKNSVDPIQEYLNLTASVWDGRKRIHVWGTDIAKFPDAPHTNLVMRKWILALTARGLYPGCKMDNILVLTGAFGAKKSTFFETVASPEFFSDTSPDFASKDGRMAASRFWLIELGEMATYRHADKESVKAWLSARKDSIRVPYGAAIEDFPRRCAFAGTANDPEMLYDPNRREWPLHSGPLVDTEAVAKYRDQLFGEAVHTLRAAEKCNTCAVAGGRCEEHSWWMSKRDEARLMAIAKNFETSSVEEASIFEWWVKLAPSARPAEFTLEDAAALSMEIPRDRLNHTRRTAFGKALRNLGFEKRRLRGDHSIRVNRYYASEVQRAPPQGDRDAMLDALEAAVRTLKGPHDTDEIQGSGNEDSGPGTRAGSSDEQPDRGLVASEEPQGERGD